MRPPSQIEVKCWLCPITFKTKRQLKNHLAAAPHRRLSIICVWCDEEKSYRRMVDLKDHIWTSHRSKIELMPSSFLTENNGFWMAAYHETYAKIIRPSNENSIDAMKARIEVLDFLSRVERTTRSKEQWIEGWKCPKDLIVEDEETTTTEEPSKRPCSPSRPNMYEDMQVQVVHVGLGNTYAIFRLDLDVTIRDYQVFLKDEVLKEPRMLDSLIRRMTALIHTQYTANGTFTITLEKDLQDNVGKVVAKKLTIREEYIEKIKTTEELFPAKRQKLVTPLSPLHTPSTSEIVLDEECQSVSETLQKESQQEKKQRKRKHDGKDKVEKRKGDKHKHKHDERNQQDKEKPQDKQNSDVRQKESTNKKGDREHREEQDKEKPQDKQNSDVRQKESTNKKGDREHREEQDKEKPHDKQNSDVRQKESTNKKREEQDKELLDTEGGNQMIEMRNETTEVQQDEQGRQQLEDQREPEDDEMIKELEKQQVGEKPNEEKQNEKETIGEESQCTGDQQQSNEDAVKERERLEEERQRLEDERRRQHIRQEIEQRMLALEKKEEQERERLENEKRTKEEQIIKRREKKDRATELLRKGGMPLFPAGWREWDNDEIITLITVPTTLKWPPKNWREMSADQKYFNWEFASIALELTTGKPLQMSQEDLLLKYHFLALPGTKAPTVDGDNAMLVKSRFYLYTALKQIVKTNKTDNSTNVLLNMLETAITRKEDNTDDICQTIDNAGINLRSGDE